MQIRAFEGGKREATAVVVVHCVGIWFDFRFHNMPALAIWAKRMRADLRKRKKWSP
jgi:hypothetical protein